jgi:hypothetical protein
VILEAILTAIVVAVPIGDEYSLAPGTIGHYAVLTCWMSNPPPVGAVDFICGPSERVSDAACTWWQLDIRKSEDAKDATPLVQVRGLTSRNPLAGGSEPAWFERYMVRIPAAGETIEYRNVHTGRALLPGWGGFEASFVPHPVKGTERQAGLPETAEYLGHLLTLRSSGKDVPWEAWDNVKVLNLDPELLVGTARGFKDKEGHRLPQKPTLQEYTYVPFTEEDFRVMIDVGINVFWVEAGVDRLVRTRDVFYIRGHGDGPSALQYPADLYRSNYLGPAMFMDEPACLMMGDKALNGMVRYFSDGTNLLTKRVRAIYNSNDDYGRYALERPNAGQRINIGGMRLDQYDFPSWETRYDTAWYQMAGGCNGIVHEGRYQLADFDKRVTGFIRQDRKHTVEQLLKFHYAFLRGGVRPFGKFWGTSIYGQCDPAISPKAVTLAYDMGARYIWYWTSDHDHHLPWVEQIELTRKLRKHAAEHPRPSIFGPKPTLDLAITIPYGYCLSIEDISWARILNDPGKNEALLKYERLMGRLLAAFHEACDRNEDFDITVDDGREITGYRKIVRITDEK